MSCSEFSGFPRDMNRREMIKQTALVFGMTVSPSAINLCLAADREAALSGNWTPNFISKDEAAVLEAATELILPRTDNPGAKDLAIPQLIDMLYGRYLSDGEKTTMTNGLTALEQEGFHLMTVEDQATHMTKMARSNIASNKTFLRKLRELTLLGYFTSEEVGRNITRYDPIPGPFKGCIPVSEIGNVIPTR